MNAILFHNVRPLVKNQELKIFENFNVVPISQIEISNRSYTSIDASLHSLKKIAL